MGRLDRMNDFRATRHRLAWWEAILAVCAIVVLFAIVLAIGTAFWSWVLMLVAGAVGVHWHGALPGFWTCVPVGFLLALITGTGASKS